MVKLLKVKGYDVPTPKTGNWEITDPTADFTENAGVDFFVPNLNLVFEKDFKEYNKDIEIEVDDKGHFINLKHGQNVIIPAGWYTKVPANIAFTVCNKSGVANKQHLSYAAHIVDHAYQGNLLLSVFNYGVEDSKIYLGKKLVQLLQVVIETGMEIVDENTKVDDFFGEKSVRGDGALGSTGL